LNRSPLATSDAKRNFAEFTDILLIVGLEFAAARCDRYSPLNYCGNLTPRMLSGNGISRRGPVAARFHLHQNFDRCYRIEADRCLQPCKVSGGFRTKMFHVKHF
jgi:hypothetical protein